MSPQAVCQLTFMLIVVTPQTEMIYNLRNRLCVAFLLQVLHRKGHLGFDLCAIARELGLRVGNIGGSISLALCGRGIRV